MRPLPACLIALSLCASACSSSQPAAPADAFVASAELLRAPLYDMAGKPVVVADVLAAKKRVALVFWQAWCAPCRAEAPAVAAASREHAAEMEVIGVVSGPDETVDAELLERTIAELSLPYRTVRDRALDLTRAFEVVGVPTIVVLGDGGRVLYRGHALPDWDALL